MAKARIPIEERFWAKVEKTQDCWLWTGALNSRGYGVIWANERGAAFRASRLSWEIHNGEIPTGKWVLHHCDNPAYVRPSHLFLGTPQDNTQDMIKKGRRAKLCNGRKLTAKQVEEIRTRPAERQSVTAKRYGVSQSVISHILSGKAYATTGPIEARY